MLKVGDILDNKYKVVRLLGRGAWGKVYLAENIKLGNYWAVKEIDLAKDTPVNLLAEPGILKKLNHRSLPRIIDILRVEDLLYIVEDYFEGANLKELINRRDLCTEENVICWGLQLCDILMYLHKLSPPIIYRDMKPGNIIIDSENNVKLVDFGIAREYVHGQDSDSTFIGTRGYAAPEQFSAGQQSDARTDVYGLGASLYHMLTGVSPNSPPYQFQPLRKLNPAISKDLERIVLKCVEDDPNRRYQKVAELLADLEGLRNNKGGLGSLLKNWTLQQPCHRKTVFVEKLMGTITIAVGGTSRGVGTTYTAISLAVFLAERGFRVAVAEINDHPVFYTLQEDSSGQGRIKGSFTYNKVDFCMKNLNLGEIMQSGYEYLILDLGTLTAVDPNGITAKSNFFEEMIRADQAILVAGAAIWQLKDLAPFLKESSTDRWKFLFRTPHQRILNELRAELKCDIYGSAFNPDPFKISEAQVALYEEILKKLLPKNERKRGLVFWK